MADFATICGGLDGLSEVELRSVAALVAVRLGSPASSLQFAVATGRGKPLASSAEPGGDVITPDSCGHLRNAAFHGLMSAVEQASAPIPSGAGRKGVVNERLKTLAVAWDKVPEALKRPFRASETRTESSSSEAATPTTGKRTRSTV